MSENTEERIRKWRERIDAIDERLLELLNERAVCSIEIGWIKRAENLEIYVPQRETEILSRMTKNNPGPLTPDAIRRLFERIIDESRSIERVACAGESERKSGRGGRGVEGRGSGGR